MTSRAQGPTAGGSGASEALGVASFSYAQSALIETGGGEISEVNAGGHLAS